MMSMGNDDGTVRYGVIGTGMMGVEHIENIRALDGGTVTAIADPDANSRATGAQAAGQQVAVFDDHHDLIDSDLCDAVAVGKSASSHFSRDISSWVWKRGVKCLRRCIRR